MARSGGGLTLVSLFLVNNVWLVYFNVVVGKNSTFTGCVVEVSSDAAALHDSCKKPP
jgi:hypothetical protein